MALVGAAGEKKWRPHETWVFSEDDTYGQGDARVYFSFYKQQYVTNVPQ